jgi:hypothetical protein
MDKVQKLGNPKNLPVWYRDEPAKPVSVMYVMAVEGGCDTADTPLCTPVIVFRIRSIDCVLLRRSGFTHIPTSSHRWTQWPDTSVSANPVKEIRLRS